MHPILSVPFIVVQLALSAAAQSAPATTRPVDPLADAKASTVDFAQHFAGFEGCAVVYDPRERTVRRFNAPRCSERFVPCSTFKIPNSLIGLETGVIPDADHVIKWDGVKRWREELNHDHTLRTAFRDSVVWYYQELARRVGREKMQEYVQRLAYGNADISGPIDEFWLSGPLRISADEQVVFIDRLRRGDLPFSKRTHDIVRDIMTLEQKDGWTLRGKTGTEGAPGRDGQNVLGWFVGWTESKDRTLVFAVNISGDGASGAKAKDIAMAILRQAGAGL
jgi:beta-lactamase class D